MNLENNQAAAARLMDKEPDTDLFVLPEMWATGFNTALSKDLAESSRKALDWMQQQADKRQCAVAGSLAMPDGDLDDDVAMTSIWHNRFYFVRPGMEPVYYDKRNLFIYGGELLTFSPGKERVVVEWKGIRFMLQVCFDLRFPETGRNQWNAAYDVLLYVASWPVARRSAWDVLLKARAIENQAYVVGVNRVGIDPNCVYDGGSAVIDPNGNALVEAGREECITSFVPDMERLRNIRQAFNVLR